MAETLTYDPGTDEVTNTESLSQEEQESLKVGEELAEQEGQLLAGKYKDAEELEKAYVELQKKFGEKNSEDSESTSEADNSVEDKETSEETEETTEDSPALALIKEASTEYYDNDGEIKPETLERFNEMSSQDIVSAYLQAQKENPQQPAQQQEIDVSDNDINSIKNSVGGENEYSNVVQWASDNLDSTSIEAFDQLVSTGNVPAIKLAIAGLKSQYDNANGFEGTMLSGKAPKTSGDSFRSQAELVKAMGDPRYDNDPAYRQDVIDKLERSDNLQF